MRASRAEIIRYICNEIQDLYSQAEERRSIALMLASEEEGTSFTTWLVEQDTVIDLPFLEQKVGQIAEGRPLQYVVGHTEFCGYKFYVAEGVLIPRPETEELVLWARDKALSSGARRVLDLCSGSGCIAISLAKLLDGSHVVAVELSDEALAIAKQNDRAQQSGVEFVKDDVLGAMDSIADRTFDMIISNPPYIPQSEQAAMRINVTNYEPKMALFVDDATPLLFYEAIADAARRLLTEDGWLLLEVHEDYAAMTASMLEQRGFVGVEIREDFRGKPRMICCQNNQRNE